MSNVGRYGRLEEDAVPIAEFMKRYKRSTGEKYGISRNEYLLAKRFARVCAYSNLLDKIEAENKAQTNPSASLSVKIRKMREEIIKLVNEIDEATSDGREADRTFNKLEAGVEVEGSFKELLRLAKTEGNFREFTADIGGKRVSERHVRVKNAAGLLHSIASAEFKLFLEKSGSITYFEPRKLRRRKDDIWLHNKRKVDMQTRERTRAQRGRGAATVLSVDGLAAEAAALPHAGDTEHVAEVVGSPSRAADFESGQSEEVARLLGTRLDADVIRESTAILPVAAQKVALWERSDFEVPKIVERKELDRRVDEELQELTFSMFKTEDIGKFDDKRNKNKAFQKHLARIYKDLIISVNEVVDEGDLGKEGVDDKFIKKVSEKMNDWTIEHLGRKMEGDEELALRYTLSGVLKTYAEERKKMGEEVVKEKAARASLAVGAFIANTIFVLTVVGPIVQAVRGKKAAEIFVPEQLMRCYDPLSKSRKNIFDKADEFLLKTIRAERLQKTYPENSPPKMSATFVKPGSRYKKSSRTPSK